MLQLCQCFPAGINGRRKSGGQNGGTCGSQCSPTNGVLACFEGRVECLGSEQSSCYGGRAGCRCPGSGSDGLLHSGRQRIYRRGNFCRKSAFCVNAEYSKLRLLCFILGRLDDVVVLLVRFEEDRRPQTLAGNLGVNQGAVFQENGRQGSAVLVNTLDVEVQSYFSSRGQRFLKEGRRFRAKAFHRFVRVLRLWRIDIEQTDLRVDVCDIDDERVAVNNANYLAGRGIGSWAAGCYGQHTEGDPESAPFSNDRCEHGSPISSIFKYECINHTPTVMH